MGPMKGRLEEALREGNESYINLMEEIFREAGWLAPEVLKGMRESDDFYCSLPAQIRSPKLHDGRVVLLGDADYATPGFGTSLAMVGAYVMAGELLNHSADIKTALMRYEELMRPFVKGWQGNDGAMRLRRMEVRNAILRFVTGTRVDKLIISGAAALGFGERRRSMPDYQWPY